MHAAIVEYERAKRRGSTVSAYPLGNRRDLLYINNYVHKIK